MEKIDRSQHIAVRECMELLATTIYKMDTKTDALLYFQFEDLINEKLGLSINHSDRGEIYQDGVRRVSRWEIAREEYMNLLNLINRQ